MFQLANTIMRFLGDGASAGAGEGLVTDKDFAWVNQVINAVKTILTPILAIVAAAGIVWAIVLGVQMARADSTEKREEAKKRLIGLIVGIVILVVLIIFFTTLFPMIMNSLVGTNIETGGTVPAAD